MIDEAFKGMVEVGNLTFKACRIGWEAFGVMVEVWKLIG